MLAVIAAWESSHWDLRFAGVFGNAHGFAWRDQWFLSTVLHEGGRRLSWLLSVALGLGVWWPFGWLDRLDISQRIQLSLTCLTAASAVALLKSASTTSCPWDLRNFGGLAQYVSHWQWARHDGGSGHCFPAGHASSGFAFMGGWFVFRRWPQVAQAWLGASLVAGLALGLAQQARGAHFMSHTLWSAWICWMAAWGIDTVWPAAAEGLIE